MRISDWSSDVCSSDLDAEISVEVDPRTATAERLAHLAGLGFNRLSLGVQDFDPAVQRAVHRIQSYESVRDLMHSARQLGYASVNMDLIYGLPLQTAESRSEEHTSELQSLMRISYAVFCLKKKNTTKSSILNTRTHNNSSYHP